VNQINFVLIKLRCKFSVDEWEALKQTWDNLQLVWAHLIFGATTFGITALVISTHYTQNNCKMLAVCRKLSSLFWVSLRCVINLSAIMRSIIQKVKLCVTNRALYAKCCNIEFHYFQSNYSECHYAQYHHTVSWHLIFNFKSDCYASRE
jgi:hypothetical protein